MRPEVARDAFPQADTLARDAGRMAMRPYALYGVAIEHVMARR